MRPSGLYTAAALGAASIALAVVEVQYGFREGSYILIAGYSEAGGNGNTAVLQLSNDTCLDFPDQVPVLGSVSKPLHVECTFFHDSGCAGTTKRVLNSDKGLGTNLFGSIGGAQSASCIAQISGTGPVENALTMDAGGNSVVTLTLFSRPFGLGNSETLSLDVGTCTEVPAGMNDQVNSLHKPRQGVTCTVWENSNCSGRKRVIPADKGMGGNLPARIDDRVSAVECTLQA